MRILHVIPTLNGSYGGPVAAIFPMAKAVAARGHHVRIATTDWHGPPTLPPDSVDVASFPCRVPFWAMSPGLGRYLGREIPATDVVHIHSLYLFHTFAAAQIARRSSVPYIVRPHGTLTEYHRGHKVAKKRVYEALVERRLLAHAAFLHFTAERERDEAAGYAPHVRRSVIPLGVAGPAQVADAYIDAAAADRLWPMLRGRRVVLFLGRLVHKKQPAAVVSAFAKLADQFSDVDLVMAGPGDSGVVAEIDRTAADAGIHARVHRIGYVDGDAKWALLRRASVFVLPSLEENFGMAVVEAMHTGTPVVVTPGVAMHDVLLKERAGVVIQSVDDLDQALVSVLARPHYAAELGARGRVVAARVFGWEASAERLEAMYNEARGLPGAARRGGSDAVK